VKRPVVGSAPMASGKKTDPEANRPTERELTALLLAAEHVRDALTAYVVELSDPRKREGIYAAFGPQIFEACRVVHEANGGTEAARCHFFRIVEEAASALRGDDPPNDAAAFRADLLANADPAQYVALKFDALFPAYARTATLDLIGEAIEACRLAKPGRPTVPGFGGKWQKLVVVWHKISGEKVAWETAKSAMKKLA
jgi:hypothetical protein